MDRFELIDLERIKENQQTMEKKSQILVSSTVDTERGSFFDEVSSSQPGKGPSLEERIGRRKLMPRQVL